MAILIRFESVIVRKAGVEERYPGGMHQFRRDAVAIESSYFEDHHLAAAHTMGASGDAGWPLLDELLDSAPLVSQRGVRCADYTGGSDYAAASQMSGIDPSCDWLEQMEIDGGWYACFLKSTDPGYLVDCKPCRMTVELPSDRPKKTLARPFHDWRDTPCPECGDVIGLSAAVQAIDLREYKAGPLGFVSESPHRADTHWVVACPSCSRCWLFDKSGAFSGPCPPYQSSSE